MCGIAGLISASLPAAELEERVRRQTHALRHRGPDGEGARAWPADEVRSAVALGHRRLAIIDLRECGVNPLANEDGTVWVVFNGEIYNFRELRRELERQGHRFATDTDTEVLVHLYEEVGPRLVERLVGIFAFAILDTRGRRVLLARDQLGIKPLYYAADADGLAFGSEIKAVLAARDDPRRADAGSAADVDWQAVYDYFTYLYVPGPRTAFAGVSQLPPAHTLLYDLERRRFAVERYWQVRRLPEVARASRDDVADALVTLLGDAVRRELVSDVPLGLFLSGGLDSAALAGLAARAGVTPETFTVDFTDPALRYYSEAALARETSRFLGTTHRELTVDAVDPIEMLALVDHFDQPFGNPTFYLQWLIARAAREHITVALSGAGGDELFAGYPRYRAAQLSGLARRVPDSVLGLGRRALALLRDEHRTMRLRRVREFLAGLDPDPVREFVRWTYHLTEEDKRALFGNGAAARLLPSERTVRALYDASPLDGGNRLLHVDVQSFLVDNLLEYTDKMSMAVSMEVRVPMLEPQLVEYALNVPFRYKLGPRGGKRIVRHAFRDFLAPAVRAAPKRGFNAPLGRWLRMGGPLDEYFAAAGTRGGGGHPLKERLGDDVGATWRDGVLDWGAIDRMRAEHRAGRQDLSHELLAVIVFDVWWRKYVTRTAPRDAGDGWAAYSSASSAAAR